METDVSAVPVFASIEQASGKYQYQIFTLGNIPFLFMHVMAVVAVVYACLYGFRWRPMVLCGSLYLLRMFGISAGFHRYFAHRSYQARRWFIFLLAVIGSSAAQKGVLWWAANHRLHHKFTDKPEDVHSPVLGGFWWSHVGWVLSKRYNTTDLKPMDDVATPEIRWLNRYHIFPAIALAIACFIGGALFDRSGTEWLLWGFFESTFFLYHGTFSVNSLSHLWGSRRYKTADGSRNNFLIALWTMGEGWHNNHHWRQASVRQGHYWWEIDMSYYVLVMLSWCHIVRGLKKPRIHVLTGGQTGG